MKINETIGNLRKARKTYETLCNLLSVTHLLECSSLALSPPGGGLFAGARRQHTLPRAKLALCTVLANLTSFVDEFLKSRFMFGLLFLVDRYFLFSLSQFVP